MQQPTPHTQPNTGPALGMCGDIAEGALNLIEKLRSQSRLLDVIVGRGRQQLLFGRLDKSDRIHCRRARASRKTSAAGREERRPWVYAS